LVAEAVTVLEEQVVAEAGKQHPEVDQALEAEAATLGVAAEQVLTVLFG
jgi:hypothetical protein